MKPNNVTYHKEGGYGNNLFQISATKIFAHCFNFNHLDNNVRPSRRIIITDDMYYDIIVNKKFDVFKGVEDTNFLFYGFFQCSKIINEYKDMIISYFNMPPVPANEKDICCALRLSDFVKPGHEDQSQVIHPSFYTDILDTEKYDKVYIQADRIKTDGEKKYIQYFSKYNPILLYNTSDNRETNMMDYFNHYRQFKKMIISCSTFHWWACLLGNAETIYMPENFDEYGVKTIKSMKHVKIYDVGGKGIRKHVRFTDYTDL